MNNEEYDSLEKMLDQYDKGQRKFSNLNFDENGSVEGCNLIGVEFINCFLFLDFRGANLTNTKFINCNIKTADFRGANLTNGLIKDCSVESTIFKGAIVKNFQFEANYHFGVITKSGDFEKFFKNAGKGRERI